jgi:hypothetical protein
MFDEDDDEEGFGLEEQLRKQMREVAERIAEQSKKDFIDGCYTAYDMLVEKGESALDDGDMEAIAKAINRMTALFIHREEYERCKFLSDYVSKYMPEHVIVPDEEIVKSL